MDKLLEYRLIRLEKDIEPLPDKVARLEVTVELLTRTLNMVVNGVKNTELKDKLKELVWSM